MIFEIKYNMVVLVHNLMNLLIFSKFNKINLKNLTQHINSTKMHPKTHDKVY